MCFLIYSYGVRGFLGGENDMNHDRVVFAREYELRTVLVLLRMAGWSQAECASILGTTRQSVSIEEQEQRFLERRALWVHDLAKTVLPEHWHEHFPCPDLCDTAEHLRTITTA